jgi:hypothetical protein
MLDGGSIIYGNQKFSKYNKSQPLALPQAKPDELSPQLYIIFLSGPF